MFPGSQMLFLTGAVGAEARSRIEQVRDKVVFKPFTRVQLFEAIDQLLWDDPFARARSSDTNEDASNAMEILLRHATTKKFFEENLHVR